MKNIPHLDLQL